MRYQPDVAIVLAERLDRGLVVEQRGDDVAVDCGRLFAYDHVVAVADGGVDHRVAVHFEHEQFAAACKPLR